GVGRLANAIAVQLLLPRGQGHYERLSWAAFTVDMAIIAYAMLVFSADPEWTTYIVSLLVVITGGFRFGPRGAFVSTGAMSTAYVAVALFRGAAFGFAPEPQRLAFHVAVFFLVVFLMFGILRVLSTLRAQR